jgi:amino acid transporter
MSELQTPTPSTTRTSNVATTLTAGRLGVPAVVFFVMAAATPLTVVAGVITLAYAITGSLGIPVAFLLVGAVLMIFSVGYVAMARRMANAGAFYAYVARGISRPAAVGAAWVALLAYNALQVGLYGAIGAAAAPLLTQWFGLDLAWWVIALVAWAIVAVLGLQQVDLNGRVLAVLLLAEVAVIVLFSIASLLNPAGGTVSFTTLDPGNLFVSGVGAILVLGVLGFVGFEASVVFSEESKNPRRTVPMATYISVASIGLLYALAAWAMSVAVGPDQIAQAAGEQEVALIFNLAGGHLGTTVVNVAWALFVTSILAAMISFHNTTARYMFALGRERVLPAALGRTSARSGAPVAGSVVQSVVGLVVIVTYAIAGWDPLVRLFYWFGTSGGFGVLVLLAVTSVAVIVFFGHEPSGESLWRRLIAPTIAALVLGVFVVLAVINFGDLLGVPASHALRWGIPAGYLVAALLGIGWGLYLRARRRDVYATIGLGAKASLASGGLGGAATPAEEPVEPTGAPRPTG